jgi:Tol biopolymer transport system component
MTLASGTRLGPYEVLAPLGAGGMGEVYRARDARLGRDVAVKVVRGEAVRDDEARRRFEREARAVAALSHPNILAIHDVGDENGQVYAVMELLEGETLRARLDRGPLAWRKAVEIAAVIADGLAAAHGKGVVHRDLKPANVFLTADGRVKVLDFGLAKLQETVDPDAAASPTLSQTQPGRLLGTVGYMSPEQVAGKPADARADIFALGCVLHEMVGGQRPFARPTVPESLAAILNEEPPELETAPVELRRLIAHCLEKDSEARFQSARDLAFDLRSLLDSTGAPRTPGGHDNRRRALRSWPVAVAAALLALAAGAAGWLLRPGQEPPPRPVVRWTLPLFAETPGDFYLDPSRSFGSFAISNDGARFVYIATDKGRRTKLYLRELDHLQTRALPGTEGAIAPFLSPDARWVGFWVGGRLKKAPVSGGIPVDIAPTAQLSEAVWGPRDEIVYSAGIPGRLWLVPAGGGEPAEVRVQGLASGGYLRPMSFLPGEGSLLVLAMPPDKPPQLEILSLETGERRVLLRRGASYARILPTGHVLLSEGGTLFAGRLDPRSLELQGDPLPVLDGIYDPWGYYPFLAVSDTGTLVYLAEADVREPALLWVDRAGDVTPVPGGQGRFFGPRSLSPTGSQAAASLAVGRERQLWIFDLERGTRRLLTAEGESRAPVWSPDGAAVTFQVNRAGKEGIASMPADGAGQPQWLFERSLRPFPDDWSPDGRSLAFRESSPNGPDLDVWIYSDGQARPFLTGALSERGLQFSPDGRLIAFVSDETGRAVVYVQPFPGPGPRLPVSTEGGDNPCWGPSGDELFYRDGDKLMVVNVETQPVLRLGRPRVLFEGDYFPFAGTSDGKRFLMNSRRSVKQPTELQVVLNWSEELKRLVP